MSRSDSSSDSRSTESAKGAKSTQNTDDAKNAKNAQNTENTKNAQNSKNDKRSKTTKAHTSRHHLSTTEHRYLAFIILSVIFSIAAALFILPFSKTLGHSTEVAGGTRYTLNVKAANGEDLTTTRRILAARLHNLEIRGLSVTESNGAIQVDTPHDTDTDIATEISTLSKSGYLAVYLIDSISDPDLVARLTSGASDVIIPSDTYPTELTSSELVSAQMISQYGYYYGLALQFNNDGQAKLKELSDKYSEVQAQLVVTIDNEVVATPTISSSMANGQLSFLLGYDGAYARQVTAMLNGGVMAAELDELIASDITPLSTDTLISYVSIVVGIYVVLAAVLLVFWRRFGLIIVGAFLENCLLTAGFVALFASNGVLIPNTLSWIIMLVFPTLYAFWQIGVFVVYRKALKAGKLPRQSLLRISRPAFRAWCVLVIFAVALGFVTYFVAPLGCYEYGPLLIVSSLATLLVHGLMSYSALTWGGRMSLLAHPSAWALPARISLTEQSASDEQIRATKDEDTKAAQRKG